MGTVSEREIQITAPIWVKASRYLFRPIREVAKSSKKRMGGRRMTAKEKVDLEKQLRELCIKEPEKYKSLRLLFALHDDLMSFAVANGHEIRYDHLWEDD